MKFAKLFLIGLAALFAVSVNAAVFVSDSFTGTAGTTLTSHTGATGATWTTRTTLGGTNPATAQIATAGVGLTCINASPTASIYAVYQASGTPASADYSATARLNVATTPTISAGYWGPIVRMTANAGPMGYALLADNTAVHFYKLTGGSGTEMLTAITVSLANSTSYDFTVQAVGSTISATVQRVSDGFWLTSAGAFQAGAATAFTTTDTTYTTGANAGIWIQSRATDSVSVGITQFAATDIAASTMSASPTTVGTSLSGQVVTLTGVGTSWSAQTFTVSGVSGTSKTAQNIISTTSATITITTGATTGTLTISDGTINTTITITASPPVTVAITDTNIFLSPYNWYSDGAGAMQSNNVKASSTFAWSNVRGSYLKFKATVGASGYIKLNLNTASLNGLTTSATPTLMWSVDGGTWQTSLLVYNAGATQLSLGSSLSSGTHSVFLGFRSVWITQEGDSWTTPANRVQITGIELSNGGTMAAPTLHSKRMIVYGDSITEGDINVNGTRSASSQDALQTYGWILSQDLDAEVGILGFYGQSWSWLDSTWNFYSSGKSRLVSSLLSPAPDYIVVNYGQNNGNPGPTTTAINTTLTSIQAGAPNASIAVLVPFSGTARTNLSAATMPTNCKLIDLAPPELVQGNTQWSYDGTHPNVQGDANVAALLANAIRNAFGPKSFGSFGGRGY